MWKQTITLTFRYEYIHSFRDVKMKDSGGRDESFPADSVFFSPLCSVPLPPSSSSRCLSPGDSGGSSGPQPVPRTLLPSSKFNLFPLLVHLCPLLVWTSVILSLHLRFLYFTQIVLKTRILSSLSYLPPGPHVLSRNSF